MGEQPSACGVKHIGEKKATAAATYMGHSSAQIRVSWYAVGIAMAALSPMRGDGSRAEFLPNQA